MPDDIVTILLLPLVLWAAQKLIESVSAWQQSLRSRYIDTVQLIDDIRTTDHYNAPHRLSWHSTLASGQLETRVKQPGYAPYMASGSALPPIFGADAAVRFSHLDSAVFQQIRRFYDLQALVAAIYGDFRGDTFKALDPERKLVVFRQLTGYYDDLAAQAAALDGGLDKELYRLETTIMWRFYRAGIRPGRAITAPTAARASSGPPARDGEPG